MKWDAVVRAVVDELNADSELTDELGTADDGSVPIYPASSSRKVTIPSVEVTTPVFDRLVESLNPMMLQIDLWARGMSSAVTIETRIRAVLHSDFRRAFADTDCATLYDDSRFHQHPEPGVVHRSLDFRFEPVRADFR